MKNNSKEVALEFELPGFERKDIDIRLSKNSLVVRARRKEEKEVKKKDFFHQEKSSQAFNYATTLPDINPKKAKIDFKKGMLKITAPKV
jgi:HSP20 family protein